jgi:hypothetical protein
MADFAIGSSPDWSRPIADDPVERSELFVAGPHDPKTPLAKSRHRGSSRMIAARVSAGQRGELIQSAPFAMPLAITLALLA